MYLKFEKLIKYLLCNFNYLDRQVQAELIDTLTYYKDITIVSRYGKE